jgi:nucleoside-diphosphate-sugar epimerase
MQAQLLARLEWFCSTESLFSLVAARGDIVAFPRDEIGRSWNSEREACTLLTVGRKTLDLRRQTEVEAWMITNRPEVVCIAVATVGGILANSTRPAEFLYDNLAIASNIISLRRGVRGGEADVPRRRLPLPAAGAATDVRGFAARRPARADQ